MPTTIPTSRAIENSCSVTAPSTNEPITSIDATGIIDVIEVLTERIRTWLSDRFIISV